MRIPPQQQIASDAEFVDGFVKLSQLLTCHTEPQVHCGTRTGSKFQAMGTECLTDESCSCCELAAVIQDVEHPTGRARFEFDHLSRHELVRFCPSLGDLPEVEEKPNLQPMLEVAWIQTGEAIDCR